MEETMAIARKVTRLETDVKEPFCVTGALESRAVLTDVKGYSLCRTVPYKSTKLEETSAENDLEPAILCNEVAFNDVHVDSAPFLNQEN